LSIPAQDLHKPEPARFRAHLSGVINFAKFREEKLVPYTRLQEATEGLFERRDQLAEQNANLVRAPRLAVS
jgi:kinetochore protein Nuf2